jgi:octaprenyl-diphosphate synthase
MFQSYALFLDQMNDVMKHHFSKTVPFIDTVAFHLINSGGKRFRPLIMFACRELVGGTIDHRLLSLAASVEMIHSATLMHDDIIDESDMRRGKKTAHILWGKSSAILVGDFLFATAFRCMTACKDIQVLDYLSGVSGTIIEGEIKQLNQSKELTYQDYIDIIAAKTGALFEASCVVAGLLDSMTPNIDYLRKFGQEFGQAFQMIDDILDYYGDQNTIKKNIGRDFFEKKMTLPSLLSYSEIPNFFDRDFQDVLVWMKKNDIQEKCLSFVQRAIENAFSALEVFPNSIAKKRLETFIAQVVKNITV